MTSDLEDQADEVKEEMADLDDRCDASISTADGSIENAMQQLKQEQTALAEATADLNEAMEASRLKNEEREEYVQEVSKKMKECQEGKDALQGEKFSLLKIR